MLNESLPALNGLTRTSDIAQAIQYDDAIKKLEQKVRVDEMTRNSVEDDSGGKSMRQKCINWA